MSKIIITKGVQKENPIEIVERKGIGHPDTLADSLAEFLSNKYSQYTSQKYGAILHHNFDKVGLLGGLSYVDFGISEMINPIRVLLNGRASIKFNNETIPVEKLLIKWSKYFLKKRLPLLDVDADLLFHYNVVSNTSPGRPGNVKQAGKRKYWFEPRNKLDLPELQNLVANDTSLGVGYFPLSSIEELVLAIEKKINSSKFKENKKWLGSDIKIMAIRESDAYYFTICIPQISKFVNNINEYQSNLLFIRNVIEEIIKSYGVTKFSLQINNRDNIKKKEIYLTAIGTALESGDEGLVGRGNRANGLISSLKPYSIEGVSGKNPVYYAGKVYNLFASSLAKKISLKFNTYCEVILISQVGRLLSDPYIVNIRVGSVNISPNEIKTIVLNELGTINNITSDIITFKYTTC